MSLIVNHNLMAMNAARNLNTVYSRLAASTQRLSSGLRINSAADDAAGLAIRELMRADIAVLNQGVRNASDAINMIQTAEGAMSVIDEKLIRMKELAEQAATGTYTTAQREIMDSEYQAMAAEIDRIASATDFNGIKLLDGTLATEHSGSGLKVHFGTGNSDTEDYYYIKINNMKATDSAGLQVGGGNPTSDTWRTSGIQASTLTTSVNASGSTQLFAIAYTALTAGQMSGLGYTSAADIPIGSYNMYGYMTVEDGDTLQNVIDEINDGSHASGTFQISSATVANIDGLSVNVNGRTIYFDDDETANNVTASGTGTSVGISGMTTATSIALQFAAAINANADQFGVYASTNGTSLITFSAYNGGASGNAVITTSASTSLVMNQTTLAGGASFTGLTASAFNNGSDGYELNIAMDTSGDGYQVLIFTPTGTGTALGDVIDSSSTMGLPYGRLPTSYNTTSTATAWAYGDQDSEWSEVTNGSAGGASWDGAHIRTQSSAQLALAALDTAIAAKDSSRANLGALQNRLENTITNLQIQAENLQAAESRISDVDVATEMTEFTRNNILAQSAVAMLAQANSLPMLALSLVG